MKKIICLTALAVALCSFCLGAGQSDSVDCKKDIKDKRGVMKPWKKGAAKTGKYRNVFKEAGYSQVDIDAKLANTYHEVFEGPDGYFDAYYDGLLYLFSVMHLSGNYRIITPGMK